MKELVIKKDINMDYFDSRKDVESYLKSYFGFLLYVCDSTGARSISYINSKMIHTTWFSDIPMHMSCKGHYPVCEFVKSHFQGDYKVFTCETFREAIEKMWEMEGER